MKPTMSILKLKYMMLVIDFITDWYFTRNFSREKKENKMLRCKKTRDLLNDQLEEELEGLNHHKGYEDENPSN